MKSAFSILLSLCFAAACSDSSKSPSSQLKEAWDAANDPGRFGLASQVLDDLPTEGFLPDEKFPWSDDYWPTYAGGISKRWQESPGGSDYRDYLYSPLDAQELMDDPSAVDIAKLSPAEKFDLFLNRYDFPLTKFEKARTLRSIDSSDSIPSWFGLCHGWAVASLLEKEPGPVAVVQNENGLEIPFYTSDITALLTHLYAFTSRGGAFMGTRCNASEDDISYDENGRVVESECRDVNPASLHLALTQRLGAEDPQEREAFTMDFFSSEQVWNYPVVGFEVQSLETEEYDPEEDDLESHRAPGTRELAHVEVEVYHASLTRPHSRPTLSQRDSFTTTETFTYTLELDGDGRIIGGEWDDEDRPDFIWMTTGPATGSSLLPYDKVSELLALSRGEGS